MNKKNGTAGSLIAPLDPVAPQEADVADPGTVEEVKAAQRATQTGKYGAAQVSPHRPPSEDSPEAEAKKSWIVIKLVDEEEVPVPGERYRVKLPDGTFAEGTLDEKGYARVEGFDPGSCEVTFPDLDQEAWDSKS